MNDELERAQGTPPFKPTLSPEFTFEDLEAEEPPTTPSQTHEEQAQQVGLLIPHFFEANLTTDFRAVYLVADILLPVSVAVPFGLKHCLYQAILPPRLYIEW